MTLSGLPRKPLAAFTDDELSKQIAARLFEVNLMMRAAGLRGIRMRVDLVQRVDALNDYFEIQADVGRERVP